MSATLHSLLQLRREFKAIVGTSDSVYSLLDTWPTWRQRILRYAKMEGKNRPAIQKLLDSVDSFHESRDKDGKLHVFQSCVLQVCYILHMPLPLVDP